MDHRMQMDPRMDPNRMDPRMDPNRMDPRMDPNRMDPTRMDPNRMDPNRMDPNRMDPNRMDPNRMDPNRMDPNRMDPSRMDPNRMDPSRMDPSRMDPSRMDAAYLCLDLTTKPKRGRKPNEDKKKRRKRNRPGAHIKRAKTGYFYFLDYFRKNYNKDADHISKASEITKACGAAWQAMSIDEKEPFQKLARKDRERYEAEMSVYKKERDPDKPKKPPTAYFYFLEDFRKEMKGKTVKGKRVTELCGEQWNQLTDEQKRPYMERVAVQYKKYQEAMEVYRQKKAMEATTAAATPPTQMQQQQQQQQQQHLMGQMMGNSGANHSNMAVDEEEFEEEDEDDLEEDEDDGEE